MARNDRKGCDENAQQKDAKGVKIPPKPSAAKNSEDLHGGKIVLAGGIVFLIGVAEGILTLAGGIATDRGYPGLIGFVLLGVVLIVIGGVQALIGRRRRRRRR
jgi:amino acid transporter